jgi:hypothetical protein
MRAVIRIFILLCKKSFFVNSALFFLFILFFANQGMCQSGDTILREKKYHVNYLTNSLVIAAGALTDVFAISRIKDKPSLTNDEILALNRNEINSIDRWALNQNPGNYKSYGRLSDIIEPPLFVILPALLGLDKKIRKEWKDLLFMYFEGHVITFTFYNYSWLGPTFQNRFRPLTYYSSLPMAARTDGGNRNSFYSGHTASTAYTSFFITKVYCDYHPELGAKKYLLYTAALIPPMIMGYLRVRALAHFPSDDMVGLSLGALLGIVIPELHKINYKGITVGMSSSSESLGLALNWKIPVHTFSKKIFDTNISSYKKDTHLSFNE